MNEIKNPKKPLIYYYVIVLLVVFLFNALVMPMISRNRIVEATYDEFMTMTLEGQIGLVSIQENQIITRVTCSLAVQPYTHIFSKMEIMLF